MLAESFIKFYGDAIDAAVNELKQYRTEDDIWKVPAGINNSAGNLVLHLAGNLNYFFGTLLGHTGYVRDRDREFSDKNISRDSLVKQLLDVKEVVSKILTEAEDNTLYEPYPENERHAGGTIGNQYVRLLAHLNYHLGQINYHRRLTV